MTIQLSKADLEALAAFANDSANEDESEVDLEIHFTHRRGWQVIIDVYESTSHVTAEGEWCATLDAALQSAYAAF